MKVTVHMSIFTHLNLICIKHSRLAGLDLTSLFQNSPTLSVTFHGDCKYFQWGMWPHLKLENKCWWPQVDTMLFCISLQEPYLC